jgi:tetratricopeptide (TPR) repeat protein
MLREEESKPPFIAVLEEAIINREAGVGFRLLDESEAVIAETDPSSPYALSLLLCLAQWIDLGYTKTNAFNRLYGAAELLEATSLSIIDYLRWHLVQAFHASSHENLNRAIHHLEVVQLAGEEILPMYLKFLSQYWMGRWRRRRGEYERALENIKTAQVLAFNLKAMRLVAVTKIHESWLVFQRGDRRLAFELLNEAEAELLPTGHALSLGNIESARGRFVRRSGEYSRALVHFEKAIELFSTIAPEHVNLARALVNAAYVKRLISLDMSAKTATAQGKDHARHLRILSEALAMLERARAIYAQHCHQGGTGSVLVNAGHIHLESGDIDRAAVEASNAFTLGKERQDVILMSRARNLQAAIELECAEEELGDDPDIALHANRAVQYAEEAIELARKTQNRRLLAEAYIARGKAAAQAFFEDWDIAKDYIARTAELLGSEDKDHLLQEFNVLKARSLRATGIDEVLRRWSNGETGDKSFQQIEEEFAEIIIPKVWVKCGKNVSRVATQLSISPKKVRRILRSIDAIP